MSLRMALAILALTAPVAAGQTTPPSPPPPVTVSIADTAAPPEWELRVPLSVKVEDGVTVGRMTFRVTFPAPPLEYTGLKVTDTLDYLGFGATAGKPAVTGGIASIDLELKPVKAEWKPLRSGVATILIFKVAVDAEEKSFPIRAEDVKAWTPPPAATAIKAGSEREAMFVVAPPGLPIFACYFYMH